MKLPEFLVDHPDGEIRLTGHRIGLYHIVRLYNAGASAEGIADEFPTLDLALIHKSIAFYLENRDEIDAYLKTQDEEIAKYLDSAPSSKFDVSELRRRFLAMQKAKAS